MPIYRLSLGPTYHRQGMFNVPVDFERFVRRDDGPITLRLGRSGPEVEGKVNRSTANMNGTPRVFLPKEGKDWLRQNFDVDDTVSVEFNSPTSIILY